ncbi:MAG TPA: hypothetical protein VLD85_14465 [Anaeromyxobacteraceae bacterium]|nr:hypothetical protein [Anaeromyxobacteraceae bacterium]
MSGEGAPADEWSDHDFFVVVRPGAQERFRRDLAWLPDPGEIAFSFQETAHGLKVVYRSGHLLEFAVFDPEEISLARVNRYRVLLDRADVASRMARVREETAAAPPPGDRYLLGQFLTSLLVGSGRWRRGERLSGEQLVRQGALGHLLRLVAAHVPPDDAAAPDGLDPFRRFERAWPRLAAEIHGALAAEVPETARRLLLLAARELGPRVDLPPAAVEAVQRAIAGT